MLGILTNFKEWIFTMYDYEQEVNLSVGTNGKAIIAPFDAFSITILNEGFEIILEEL